MNNEDNEFTEPSPEGTDGTAPEGVPTDRRPLGYWLRTVDGLITREFAAAFDGADVTRRDWMLLNALSGDVEQPAFAERFARKGKRLRGLAERGWVEESGDGTWVLTDEGRDAKERLGTIVDGIRSRVAGAVSPEDYATTIASLASIARELGWEEGQRMARGGFGRGFSRGRGFGPAFRPGFGPAFRPGFGAGFRPGFGADDDDAAHGEGHDPRGAHHRHPHRGHGAHHEHGSHYEHGCHHAHGGRHHGGHRGHGERSGRSAQSAYERGFDAGFSRGRTSDRATDGAVDAA